MASSWQVRANIRNAARSTGPKSVEGKDNSRRNAVTHGFYASVVDDRSGDPDFETERNNWIESFSPRNETTRELADVAFFNLKRLNRLYDVEEACVSLKARAACDAFDLQRREAIDAAEADLIEKPYANYILLTSTVVGCERMIEILDRLDARLENGSWDDECLLLLRAARGKGGESRDKFLKAASDFVIRHQPKMPNEKSAASLLDEALGVVPEPIADPELDLSEQDSKRLIKAWEILLERIEEDRGELNLIKGELEGEDDHTRRLYMVKSQMDFGPEGQTLRRCIAQATQAFHKSYANLQKASGVDLSKTTGPVAAQPQSPPPPAPKPPERIEPKSKPVDFVGSGAMNGLMNFSVGRAPEMVTSRR